jgi:hypothetical protein
MDDTPSAEQVLEFLIDSARYGDTDDVRMALSQYSAPVNGTDEDGRTGEFLGFSCAVREAAATAER